MITILRKSFVEPACGRSAAVTHAFQRQFTNLHPAILEQRHSHWTKDRRYIEHTWSSRWTWKAGEFRRDKAFNGHALWTPPTKQTLPCELQPITPHPWGRGTCRSAALKRKPKFLGTHHLAPSQVLLYNQHEITRRHRLPSEICSFSMPYSVCWISRLI